MIDALLGSVLTKRRCPASLLDTHQSVTPRGLQLAIAPLTLSMTYLRDRCHGGTGTG
ncbi:MAG: hypothetical protein ACREQD_05895 [Candidatus Binataceae bacterium]